MLLEGKGARDKGHKAGKMNTNSINTKITQIKDRSAATAWSPIAEYPSVIALGIKVRDHAVLVDD